MKRREELRRRYRRIMAWSIGGAVLAHVGIFVVWPEMRAGPIGGWTEQPVAEASERATPLHVRIRFGNPVVFDDHGRPVRVDRDLEVDHLLPRPTECEAPGAEVSFPAEGRVRMRVWSSGRSDVLARVGASAGGCMDAVIAEAADALNYLWLPNERFPAPVELIQPVTVLAGGTGSISGTGGGS